MKVNTERFVKIGGCERMIQDIDAVYHNEYDARLDERGPENDDYVMFVTGRNVLMKKDTETISYLTYKEIKEKLPEEVVAYQYLFRMDIGGVTTCFYLGMLLGQTKISGLPSQIMEQYQYENHNVFRDRKPKYLAFAGVTACQLANWYESTRYCGRCGVELEHDKKERMMRCPGCGAMHYPKISPAVIVAVLHGDKILMTKYADRDYKKYALIAGFVEIGETVEETVRREVMEEVGVRVKNIRYYKSQPWSFSDTELFGFFCELDGEDTICMDENELSVAQWLSRDEIPTEYDGISLTNEMIMRFKNGEEGPKTSESSESKSL